MFRRIRYGGQLVNALRKPWPDVIVVLEIHLLDDGWTALSEAQTVGQGKFKGSIAIDDFADSRVAPQFRLIDTERNFAYNVTPATSLSRGALVLDFGTIVRDEAGARPELDPAVTAELTKIKMQLYATELELGETKARLDNISSSLASVTEERDGLQLELEQIRKADEASPKIVDLAGRLATSLVEATTPDDTTGFRLDGATVKLKGYLADGGNRFKPLDAAELASANAAGASEISFRLRPPAPGTATGMTMPDVIGLTAGTARRTLRPLGVEVQVVESPGNPVGAVIAQTPAAGASVAPGSVIHLQVATES